MLQIPASQMSEHLHGYVPAEYGTVWELPCLKAASAATHPQLHKSSLLLWSSQRLCAHPRVCGQAEEGKLEPAILRVWGCGYGRRRQRSPNSFGHRGSALLLNLDTSQRTTGTSRARPTDCCHLSSPCPRRAVPYLAAGHLRKPAQAQASACRAGVCQRTAKYT
eukprot:364664-Chlamydomonas_euryale.AAC.7